MIQCQILILVLSCISTTLASNSWNNPASNQYHIQTDEGPERYFRYQTLSGQYRKEKRLEDGTVVGTYAWIDDDGYLRQRDYIADNAGYRILKTKNIFVGRNIPIGDAVKAAKKVPASAGTLVNRPVIRPGGYSVSTESPLNAGYVSSTPAAILPSSTLAPPVSSTPSSIYLPSSSLPPSQEYLPSSTPSSVYLPSTTPSSVYLPSSTASPYVEIHPNAIPSSTPAPTYTSTVNSYLDYSTPSTTSRPAQYLPPNYPDLSPQINSIDYNPYVNQNNDKYYFQNGPTYPIDRKGQSYTGQKIGNGYDPQYPYYDGVSVTNDGFRYYIPRAYHEEQNLPGDRKTGSFGYIDPFGIRRVIYYNTAPGSGFQHRKNNRYVGFGATPYDPRPY